MAKRISAEEFAKLKEAEGVGEPAKRISPEEFTKLKEGEAPTVGERAKGLALGAAQGVTLGFADEIAAAGAAVKDLVTGKASISDAYNERLNNIRESFETAEERTPGAFLSGDIGASILAGLASGGSGLFGKAATRLGRAAVGAGTGAAVGAVEGAGRAEEDRLGGAVTGAGLGAAGGAVVGGLAAASRGILTKANKAAKLGATAKQLESRLGDEHLSQLEKTLPDLQKLNIVRDKDFTRAGPGILSGDTLREIGNRADEVRTLRNTIITEEIDKYKIKNPDKLFSIKDLGLDELVDEMGDLVRTGNNLDPTIFKSNRALKDIQAAIQSDSLDIRKLVDLKKDISKLSGEPFFQQNIGSHQEEVLRTINNNLRTVANKELGSKFAEANADLSNVHVLEGVLKPALGKVARQEGAQAGQGLLDPLVKAVSQKGISGAALSGGQSLIDVAGQIPGGVPAALTVGPTQGAPRTHLDPKDAEDRILIKGRIRKRFVRGELDSREMAKKLQNLNELQEADDEDSRIIELPSQSQSPDLDILNRVIRPGE